MFSMAWNAISVTPEQDRRRFARILREIKSTLSSEYGAKLLVLYFSGQTWRGELMGARETMVPLFCQADVSFVEVNSLLRGSSEPAERFYIAGDGHPTPQLNRLLASEVIKTMEDVFPSSACPR